MGLTYRPMPPSKNVFATVDRIWLIADAICRLEYRMLVMAFVLLVSGLLFSAGDAHAQVLKCLPPDIRPETVVGSVSVKQKDGSTIVRYVTVGETLKNIGARCRGSKLVDRKGCEIRIFNMKGCWGNPPADYLEILDDQKKEIQKLKKKFTVIEVGCETGEQTVLSAPPTRP